MKLVPTVVSALLGMGLGWAFQSWSDGGEQSASQAADLGAESALSLTREGSLSKPQTPPWIQTLLDESADPIAKLYASALCGNAQGDLAQELQALADLSDYSARKSALRSLLAAHVERDPEAAFAICRSFSHPRMRREALKEVARLWAAQDPEEALKQIDSLKEDPAHQDLLLGYVTGLGSHDPEAAVELVFARGMDDDTYQIRPWFKSFATSDPIKAMTAALRFKGDHQLAQIVLKEWSASDPTGAFDYLLDMDSGLDAGLRRTAFEVIGEGFAKYSPEEAVDWASALTETAISDSESQAFVKKVAEGVAKTDPEMALDLLAEISTNHSDYRNVYLGYAAKDWESAYESAIALESDEVRSEAVLGLLQRLGGLSKEEIEANFENLLDHLPEGDANYFYNSEILPKLDDETVLSLAERYPEKLEKLMRNWAVGFRSRDPEESVELISRIDHDGARDTALQETMAHWGRNDPEAASAWVLTQPESEMRGMGFRNLVNAWVRMDPESTRTWLTSQPASDSRDQGMREYASITASTNPQGALSMADQIEDEKMRESALGDAFEGLLWQNPVGAQDLLKDYTLSPELQKRLDAKTSEFAIWKSLAQEPAESR